MNSILIVLPILTVLMFDLGLTLEGKDFLLVLKRFKAFIAGLAGQIIILPLIAWGIASLLNLSPMMSIGLVLIACCPGGSSSNVFSKLAKGDVALSVSLTAVSSIVTLFTIPLIMQAVTAHAGTASGIHLPVRNLLMQNIVTMLLPILMGIRLRHCKKEWAISTDNVLSRLAFPALLFLAAVFFIQHRGTIVDNFQSLGLATTVLLLCATAAAAGLCFLFRLRTADRRTIIVLVGMQNASQSIAIAGSPFVFNDGRIAIPAIIYALMMNVVLLIYVGIVKNRKTI